jgi:hypothetical protein
VSRRVGHLSPRLLRQSEYNDRLMEAAPVPCGQSVITARRSNLYGYAGFGLANPKLLSERQQARKLPAGLWARTVQRLLALNACIWHNWLIGAPVKRSLIAYDR